METSYNKLNTDIINLLKKIVDINDVLTDSENLERTVLYGFLLK